MLRECKCWLIFRLKGDEEVIGGYDLIYKAKDIVPSTTSMYTTMLGAKNSR